MSIAESFASALLVAGAPPAGNGEGADTSGIGTRVLIRILNLSANIAIYAPQQISTNTPGGTLTLTLVTGADSNGAGGSVLAVPSPATSSLISGASITYETTANNASLIERADIPLGLFTTGTPTAGTMTINVFLAPVSALGSAAPTGAAPIPRFSEVAAQSQVPPGQPAILLSASNFDLSVPVGTRPSPQTLAVTNSGGGILNWTAAINSITGGNWLTLSPTSGTEDTNVLVSLNSAALAVGTYSAKVLVSAPGASNSPQTLTVTLNVTSTSLLLTPSSISFNSLAGSNPAPQRFSILTGGGVLNWNATVNSPGGNWLTISPSSGVTPATITATANSAGLNPGSYQGLITVSAPGASTAQAVTVTFVLGAPTPVVAPNGIVNGASFSKEAVVSPGSISTLFGSNLAATTAAATTTPLPLTLAATQVLVNESSAPLFYVSPTQINFQMPTGLLGSTAQIVVVSNGVRSLAASVNVLPAAPGIFTAIPGGTGQGAVLNQDSSLNSEQNPATVGTVLQIFTTGLGATVPPVLAGQPQTGTPPPETAITPTVLIAGIPAEITYSGLAPNFVGLYQVNVRVPAGISSGSAVPLQMLVSGGGASEAVSNMVTVAIR